MREALTMIAAGHATLPLGRMISVERMREPNWRSLQLGRSRQPLASLLVPLMALPACAGPQSVLDPAGREASVLADLFWVLLAAATVLWVLVNRLFVYITRINPRSLSRRLAEALIIGGGVVFPADLLGVLLGYALSIMPEQRAPGEGLTVRITGEQW